MNTNHRAVSERNLVRSFNNSQKILQQFQNSSVEEEEDDTAALSARRSRKLKFFLFLSFPFSIFLPSL